MSLAPPQLASVPELPYRRSVLPNRLRVLSQAMPGARSVAAGIYFGVGSRYEEGRKAGLSHFVEHLVFKGTRGYPEPGAISEAIEAVGGSVNASTDRELTIVSAKVPREHAAQALRVLTELATRPLFRSADVVAERPVIIDEIKMYEDSPCDHVFTLFDALLFPEHPLGREVAGTPGTVEATTPVAVRRHWAQWYRPENAALAAAGAVDHDWLVETAGALWRDGVGAEAPVRLARYSAFDERSRRDRVRIEQRRLAQGNLCLGVPALARHDPDRWALELLSAVLGDGMSSRLFVELRERRSLAYDVSTFSSMFADVGTFGVYAGFEPGRAEEVVRAVNHELDRVLEAPVPGNELAKARAYAIGRMELRLEETGAVASWLGAAEMLLPRIETPEEVIDHLSSVAPEDVLRVARRCLARERRHLALLGPFRSIARFERALQA
jgi:predicted Zn-dependent peptidase